MIADDAANRASPDVETGSATDGTRARRACLAASRAVLRQRSSQMGLDEAWVYGLIRQESRFNPLAVSPAGAVEPWLPQPAEWKDRTVQAQTGDPRSMLELYRAAIHLRRAEEGLQRAVGQRVADLERGHAPIVRSASDGADISSTCACGPASCRAWTRSASAREDAMSERS